jgi:hypothetical protein
MKATRERKSNKLMKSNWKANTKLKKYLKCKWAQTIKNKNNEEGD